MGKTSTDITSRTSSIAFCGLIIALMVVSSWITIPIGIVPITLQVFVMVFALLFLAPRQYLISVLIYLALGAVGLPVFSGMRGGLGILAGPTGGYLLGYVVAALVAFVILYFFRQKPKDNKTPQTLIQQNSRAVVSGASTLTAADVRALSGSSDGSFFTNQSRYSFVGSIIAGLVFLVVLYLCGWAQLMAVANLDPAAAFLSGVAPFIIIDMVKVVIAILAVEVVKRALPVR